MALPTIIGLCGYQGAGKDAVATALGRLGYQRVALADPVKDVALEVFRVPIRALHGTQKDKSEPLPQVCDVVGNPRTGRYIAQRVGEAFREIDPNVWVKYAEERIRQVQRLMPRVVVPDVRYRNEFEMVRRQGGVVWEVIKVPQDPQINAHSSEQEWEAERKDAHLCARAGDVAALADAAVTLARAGGRELAKLSG